MNAIKSDGTLKWNGFVANGAVIGSPCIGTNNLIYFGTSTRFYAVNTNNGAEVKSAALDNAYNPTLGADGTVYVSSFTNQVALLALDGNSLGQKWSKTFGTTGFGNGGVPAIDVTGNLYFSAPDGKVYALDGKCGSTLWTFDVTGLLGNGVTFSQPSLGRVANLNKVYVHASDGTVIQLDQLSGHKDWQVAGPLGIAPPAIGTNGTLYVLGAGGTVVSLNPATNGSQNWQFSPGAQNTTGANLALDSQDNVIFASGGSFQNVFALTSAGQLKWTFPLPGSALVTTTSPVIGLNGQVYVRTSNDGKVYSIH